MHGQEAEDGSPIRKPTGFMSNSECLLEALNRRCFGRRGLCSRPEGGVHVACLGKIAHRAAICSDTMCEIILSGFSRQLRIDRNLRVNEHRIQLCESFMLDGNDEVEIAVRECKPDSEHSRDTCSTNLRERVIHASNGRTLGYPEPSRRGSKEYVTLAMDCLTVCSLSVTVTSVLLMILLSSPWIPNCVELPAVRRLIALSLRECGR